MRRVGGEENVEWRGVLDLLGELSRGGEAENRMDAGLGFEFRSGGL
jgi:hypothetical protein